jgi:hypothetical protein
MYSADGCYRIVHLFFISAELDDSDVGMDEKCPLNARIVGDTIFILQFCEAKIFATLPGSYQASPNPMISSFLNIFLVPALVIISSGVVVVFIFNINYGFMSIAPIVEPVSKMNTSFKSSSMPEPLSLVVWHCSKCC